MKLLSLGQQQQNPQKSSRIIRRKAVYRTNIFKSINRKWASRKSVAINYIDFSIFSIIIIISNLNLYILCHKFGHCDMSFLWENQTSQVPALILLFVLYS